MLSCVVSRAPLLPIGSHHLHHDLRAIAQQFGDRQSAPAAAGAIGGVLALTHVQRGGAEDVVGVQERGALQADVHEGGLHPGITRCTLPL